MIMTFEKLKFTERPDSFGWVSRTHIGDNIEVSVVAGTFAYSSPREKLSNPFDYTLYEMAVFKDGEFTREFYDEDPGDDVLAYVDKETIVSVINKIKQS